MSYSLKTSGERYLVKRQRYSFPKARKRRTLRHRRFPGGNGPGVGYLIFSTMPWKAAGWFRARSASTLRFSSMPDFFKPPINCEYDRPC